MNWWYKLDDASTVTLLYAQNILYNIVFPICLWLLKMVIGYTHEDLGTWGVVFWEEIACLISFKFYIMLRP